MSERPQGFVASVGLRLIFDSLARPSHHRSGAELSDLRVKIICILIEPCVWSARLLM
jgi:hypothetical protein